MSSIQETLLAEMEKLADSYAVCGIVDQAGSVYPLGADTKVLSTIFELVSRPAVYAAAKTLGYEVVEPTVQNHYPDFTYHRGLGKNGKIAIDVKTTYRMHDDDKFSYTLGGYTSFIRPVNWSQKTGQLAKVYPKPMKGYEHGEAPEFFRSV